MNNCSNNLKRIILFSFILSNVLHLTAQEVSYYNNSQFNPYDKIVYQPGTNIHTSVKSYQLSSIKKFADTDSVLYEGINRKTQKLNILQRALNDHLLQWKNEDVNIKINPLFNFEFGKEQEEGKNTWTNTRGLFIEGTIGKKFYFYTDFLENQSVFPNYITDYIDDNNAVPGQGKRREYGNNGYDYAQSTGFVSYSPSKWFNFQLGQGKNFIGDGYRSLLLSDNSYSYPYFKFTAEFNKVHYHIMWAQLRDLNIPKVLESNDARYYEKFSVSHYLTFNIGNRFSIGAFESVVWAAQDTIGYRGFEFAYLNPIAFFRPIEYSLGSPDNVTMGLNTKYILCNNSALYGQFVLGEFKADEVFSGKKWWANKQGFQLGFKTFNLLGINNLYFQTEYNQVRPYTYSHREIISNYGHYNQPLAHPFGANFRESVSFLRYKYKKWYFNTEILAAIYGKDDSKDVSYGSNIYKDNDLRPSEYGNFIGQGLKTNLMYLEGSVSYLINPRNNFNIALGARIRKETNDLETKNTKMFWFAVRTSLKNIYSDF